MHSVVQNSLSDFFFDLQTACCPKKVNGVNLTGGGTWDRTGIVCYYGNSIKCYYVSTQVSPEIEKCLMSRQTADGSFESSGSSSLCPSASGGC